MLTQDALLAFLRTEVLEGQGVDHPAYEAVWALLHHLEEADSLAPDLFEAIHEVLLLAVAPEEEVMPAAAGAESFPAPDHRWSRQHGVSFDPGGTRALCMPSGSVRSLETGEALGRLALPSHPNLAVWSDEGARVTVYSTTGRRVRLEVATGKQEAASSGHDEGSRLPGSPDPRLRARWADGRHELVMRNPDGSEDLVFASEGASLVDLVATPTGWAVLEQVRDAQASRVQRLDRSWHVVDGYACPETLRGISPHDPGLGLAVVPAEGASVNAWGASSASSLQVAREGVLDPGRCMDVAGGVRLVRYAPETNLALVWISGGWGGGQDAAYWIEPTTLTVLARWSEPAPLDAFWSPDGRWFAMAGYGAVSLWRWPRLRAAIQG